MRSNSEGKRKVVPIHDIQTYVGGAVWIPSFLESSSQSAVKDFSINIE